jgi:hypothetical protein
VTVDPPLQLVLQFGDVHHVCDAIGVADALHIPVLKLDDLLKSGWSIQALKAYASSVWQQAAFDHVTEGAWRLAVEFADSNGCSGGRDFPKRFIANPERYECGCEQ